MTLEIITNNHYREFIHWFDLTKKEQEDNECHGEDNTYFRYKGYCYCLSDFPRTEQEGWDAAMSDTMFNGILIKLSECGEAVKIASYYS